MSMAKPKRPEPSDVPYTRRHLLAGWWAVLIITEDGYPDPPQPPTELKGMEPAEGVEGLLEWCALQDRVSPLIPPATWVGKAERAITKSRAE